MMKDRFKLNSISGRAAIYSFITFGMAMGLLISIMLFITDQQLRVLIDIENEEQIKTIVRVLDETIEENLTDLAQYASSATLVNAVMDPGTSDYYLPDYVEAMSIHNIEGNFTLTTFDGKIIHSTDSRYSRDSDYPQFSVFIEMNQSEAKIEFNSSNKNIIFVTPISYNGLIEGYLIFDFNFINIFELNRYLFESEKQDRRFAALHKEEIIIETDKPQQEYISAHFALRTIPVTMEVDTSISRVQEPVIRILIRMIIISIISTLFLSIIFSAITSRTLIRPLLILEQGIKNLGMGKWEFLKINKKEPIEIQFLRKSFNSMQKALRDKNLELEERNEELNKTNTNLQNTQKQLIKSEKMASIGQLAAGVAHEINNPTGFVKTNLGTMLEYLEVYKILLDHMDNLVKALKTDSIGDDKAAIIEQIENIKEEEDYPFILEDAFQLLKESSDGMNRIKKIVQDLRNFARPESEDMQPANVNRAIEDALRLSNNELKYKCKIEKQMDELPDIPCRLDQLTQVFINLFVNAAQAIEESGKIIVKTRLESKMIVAEVCDTGCGISTENIDKLFDPFFTTKRVGQGTGLGLSISYGIIEKHRGTIDVKSQKGQGTCFIIKLPLREEIGD